MFEQNKFIVPNLVVGCSRAQSECDVFYRPALLNGRHVVDVLVALRELSFDSEADLANVKRQATENASTDSAGWWKTHFFDWLE